MADNRIKVSGYAKKEVYNGNIEYRNFSPDLVGLQLTSDGGTPLFTMGNFNITTNLDPKLSRTYVTNKFSNFITLSDINLNTTETQTLLNNNAGVYLNLDKTNLSYYAKFGSMTEFVRVSLEKIIMSWPAALYITPIYLDSNYIQSQGFTYDNYSYDTIKNEATFRVNVNFIKNLYDINYITNGTLIDTFNETNDLRNLTVNYGAYCIFINNIEYDVVKFTASTYTSNDYIYFNVKGDPFSGIPKTTVYYVKPKKIYEDLFYNSLDEFEGYLLNRMVIPKYTAMFKYPLKTDNGVLLYTSKSFTWPTTDGYNIDFDTDAYVTYASSLLDLANTNDLTRSNLMNRFLVTEAITGFDTLPYYLDEQQQDTSGGKVTKLLNVYGRSFDDFNKFIEGLEYSHTVTYDKLNNIPDKYLKDLAKVLGWDLISSINNNDLLSNYVTTGAINYSGYSAGLTPVDTDVEMWRRIILNSPWIWKSKGARKSVEFLLSFIGTPNGLVEFNEYVYKVDGPIDVELFKDILQLNGLSLDLTTYPIDSDGYPKFFADTDNMYFQNYGLWHRETGGANAIIDIKSGNNPHLGPYDNGFAYLQQLTELIPKFLPITITSETISTTSSDLFTNYNKGEITNYNGETYVDVTNLEGLDISNCYEIQTTIEPDPLSKDIDDDMLSVCVSKIKPTSTETCKDVVEAIKVDIGEYYLFTKYQYLENGDEYIVNGDAIYEETIFASQECCKSYGGSPMYTEEVSYTLENPTNIESISSGYACCVTSKGNQCGCKLSCNWFLKPKLIEINGSGYLDFTTSFGLGASVVVTADGSHCPPNWTTKVDNVVDPYTKLTGVGCKINPQAEAHVDPKLVDMYLDRASGGIIGHTNYNNNACCAYPFKGW